MILIIGVACYIGSHLENYFDSKNIKYVRSGNSTSILKIIKGLEKIYRKGFNIKYKKISKNELLTTKVNILKIKKIY